jgi:hypothetical protein
MDKPDWYERLKSADAVAKTDYSNLDLPRLLQAMQAAIVLASENYEPQAHLAADNILVAGLLLLAKNTAHETMVAALISDYNVL